MFLSEITMQSVVRINNIKDMVLENYILYCNT